MEPSTDFPDDMDVSDDATARRMRRAQRREQQRLAIMRLSGPGRKKRNSESEYDDDFDDDFDDEYDEFDEDDDEFDEYSLVYRD